MPFLRYRAGQFRALNHTFEHGARRRHFVIVVGRRRRDVDDPGMPQFDAILKRRSLRREQSKLLLGILCILFPWEQPAAPKHQMIRVAKLNREAK